MYCDIFDGLEYKKYDFVTFQQRSGDSEDASTFFSRTNFVSGTGAVKHKGYSGAYLTFDNIYF